MTNLLETVVRPAAHGIGQFQEHPAARRKGDWDVENPVPSATATRHAGGHLHLVRDQLELARVLQRGLDLVEPFSIA